ncbi:hypothetical protein ZIOFF_021933 [Zingiber officinale]|uniref:Uncharacterized protein n=1 Tax=Zingiber officinale TaxID=94328 RepID=A0A8J5H239_ZINOF|nr:hypothetical protein ZIOFF_021933 [Zingiber officinale]
MLKLLKMLLLKEKSGSQRLQNLKSWSLENIIIMDVCLLRILSVRVSPSLFSRSLLCISLPSSYSRYFLPRDSAKVFIAAAVPAAVFCFVNRIHPITDDEPLTSASSFQLHSKGNLRLLPVENEVMSSSQSQQRKRGKTIMRDIHALHPDHVLVVEFNERGQPYGDLQPTLANFIGTIAQNGLVLPLHFLDWRKMPANRLNDAWKLVTSQENGRKSSRIEIQQLSRRSRKKGGAAIDDEAIRIENLLKETVDRLLQDKPEGTQPLEVHEEAFREVFGLEHSGRVRCLGAGALPSQVFPE